MELLDNFKGNYRFLTGIAPYSSGVAAMPGYEIIHAVLRSPLPLAGGFELIDRHLAGQNRPRQALCAIELRSPRPFSFEGFAEFNQSYQHILAGWELLVEERNPVARTNVAPVVQAPAQPSLYAFSYTAPAAGSPPTFVIAGAGDLADQRLSPGAIIRAGDVSPEAMQEKAALVMSAMQARLAGLQLDWPHVTTVDIYTVQPLQPYLASAILEKMGPAAIHGVHWHYCWPPISGLEFEMDMRGTRREIWVDSK